MPPWRVNVWELKLKSCDVYLIKYRLTYLSRVPTVFCWRVKGTCV